MRLLLPALVLSLSVLSSATFYVAQQEDTNFSVGQAKTIQWDTSDFEDNLDIYVGPEDADEDNDGKSKKIAGDHPNSGTFTWTPEKDDAPYKDGRGYKAKIWGKDKKGKKGKGKKLIIIIIINKPGVIVSHPGETKTVTKTHPPPVTQSYPPHVTLPYSTSISSFTYITKTHATTTQKYTTEEPPVVTPSQPTYEQPPVLITSTPVSISRNATIIVPTGASSTRPPLFTNAASIPNAKPLLAGGIIGVLAFGLL